MLPTWQTADGSIKLYHGDCRDVLPHIWCDTIVTDPPYGIAFDYETYEDTRESWCDLMLFITRYVRENEINGAWPACRRSELPWIFANVPPDWLICWYKGSPGHLSYVGFADWEAVLTYGKPAKFPIHDYFQLRPSEAKAEQGALFHPCPKPIGWARWLIDRYCADDGILCDPFMGSGTTGVAAAAAGRKFIGCEMDEKYFAKCVERIELAHRAAQNCITGQLSRPKGGLLPPPEKHQKRGKRA